MPDEIFFGDHVCDEACDGPKGCRNKEEKQRLERVTFAKSICDTCPVEDDCLEWAIRIRLDYGVAGGKTQPERAKIIRQRRAEGVM